MNINKNNLSAEELKQLASSSLDKTEFCKKIGLTYFNGKIVKALDKLCLELNIDISHFNRYNKNKRKFSKVNKNCPLCNKVFETLLGWGKEKITCSYKCSNIFFKDKRYTEESRRKISNSMRKYHRILSLELHTKITFTMYKSRKIRVYLLKKKCILCGSDCRNRHQLYCSKKCVLLDPLHRKKLSEKVNARIANGTHKGWASRTKLKPSYAEQYIINLLKEQFPNVQYVRELKVGKWFIDFAFSKTALEIDGRQHLFPERILSDQIKDEYLKNQGWKVVRIKWKKVTKEFRDEVISKLNDIVEFNQRIA